MPGMSDSKCFSRNNKFPFRSRMADYEAFTVAKENIEDERSLISKGKQQHRDIYSQKWNHI